MYKIVSYSVILVLIAFLVSCSSVQTPSDSVLDSTIESDLAAEAEEVSTLAESALGLEEGDEVTVELYDADPAETDSNLLASTTFIYGEERIRAVIKELRKTTDAKYAVISANDTSRTVELRGKNRGRGSKGKGNSILKDLEDGTIVELELFSGDPENGGTMVASSDFTIGETSLRKAFKALFNTAGDASFDYLVITVGDESQIRHIHARKRK